MKKALMVLIATIGMVFSSTAEAGWSDGMVSITNARPGGVRVMIDRTYRGSVMPTDAEAFALTPGRHHILVTCNKGYTLAEKTINIDPFEAEAITVQAQAASLSMTNSAGTILYIEVDGEAIATLSPNERTSIKVPVGSHRVKATYRQHGRSQTLSSETVRFSPGEAEGLRFTPASTGLVKVTNTFGQTARIHINGQSVGNVRAGKSKLVESPIGNVRLEMIINDRVVVADNLSVRRYFDTTFRGEEPVYAEGRLELSNMRSGTVKIYVDGRLAGSIPAWSDRTFTLALGSHQIKATSANNKVLYNRQVVIRRYDEVEIELGAQSSNQSGTAHCDSPY